ncbi:PD40 domain-containing protein [bacterium]|nr:MAG: PD40 domain-containing protein [bacterium]
MITKKNILLIISYLCCANSTQAIINFSNEDATLVIDGLNQVPVSNFKITNTAQITGWTQDSIIKNFVNFAANWTETYTAGVELGAGRRLPSTNMVVNNSNAINFFSTLAVALLNKQNSNAIAKLPQNSNAIAALARLELSNSNDLATLSKQIRATSNTLLKCLTSIATAVQLRTESNAVASFRKIVIGNSQALPQQSKLVINGNSNTIASFNPTLLRTTSNAFLVKNSAFTAPYLTLTKNNSTTLNAVNNTFQMVLGHSNFVGGTVNNIILYKAGITVNAGTTLTLSTPLPLSGNIALGSTGVLSLGSDLDLASDAYLTQGGAISGNNYSLVLSNSFTIPDQQFLEVANSLIFDGHGNTLMIGRGSQIIVDASVSLTLRNMTIQTTFNSPSTPWITLSPTSNLTLDNVVLNLSNDFYFNNGKLFFQDVEITGTSQFIYKSTSPSYILSNLIFSPGSGLNYVQPNNTNQDNLRFANNSASLMLDGCSLSTTPFLRLAGGRVFFDNKVTISESTLSSSQLSYNFSVSGFYPVINTGAQNLLNPYGGSQIRTGYAWSYDSQYMVLSGNPVLSSPANMNVAQLNFANQSLDILVTVTNSNVSAVRSIYCSSWHPSSDYILTSNAGGTGGMGATSVKLWRFNRTRPSNYLTLIYDNLPGGTNINDASSHPVAFSSDGLHFIVVKEYPGNNLFVFSFDSISGTAALVQTIPNVTANYSFRPTPHGGISWRKDGKYVAILTTTNASNSFVNIYSYDPQASSPLSLVSSTRIFQGLENAHAIKWSPDGSLIAITQGEFNGVHFFAFKHGQIELIKTVQFSTAYDPNRVYLYIDCDWTLDGRYLALRAIDTSEYFPLYFIDIANNYNPIVVVPSTTDVVPPAGVSNVLTNFQFDPTGNLLYSAMTTVYTVTANTSLTPTSTSSGLLFGNSALGSQYDANVYLCADSNINLYGNLNYDCVN